jgi:CRISPR-associated protein Cas2
MLIVSYDISDTKLRTHFSKFLKRFGRRLQFSVYEINNSPRFLDNVILEIRDHFEKRFEQSDSVFIFDMEKNEVHRFGYALNEEKDFLIFG